MGEGLPLSSDTVDYMLDFDKVLMTTVRSGASDLILKVGSPPVIKTVGKVLFLSDDPVGVEELEEAARSICSPGNWETYSRDGEVDFSFQGAGELGRFRVNMFRQSGKIGLVLRQINSVIPSFAQLSLPERQFLHLASLDRGLVLVTGQTGSGKSTSLAAIVDHIIQTRNEHIITLEDPIEYLFEDNLSIVNQREIGSDTESFESGLRACMREAPDVIMVGEIRDAETMEAAVAAAETGHLVLSTLHTVNAIQTIERIFTFFPPHQHDRVRMQMATVLAGVASQRLLPSVKTQGMVPVVEILLATPRIRELLSNGDTLALERALVDGEDYYGTQTFNMALRELCESEVVSLEDALLASDNPDDLKLALRGIQTGLSASRIPC